MACILGFTGMLRPHTFRQLEPHSFTFITKSGPPIGIHANRERSLKKIRGSWAYGDIIEAYITFTSKTQATARAYFPNLSQPVSPYSSMCPVAAILNVFNRGWLIRGFLKSFGNGDSLKTYLKKLTSNSAPVSPYALRIGGRTWYITQGLDRQFVDYLGTWKSPEASARYYRERPKVVLWKLRRFYKGLPRPSEIC